MFAAHSLAGVGLGVSPQLLMNYVAATELAVFTNSITADFFRILAEEGW